MSTVHSLINDAILDHHFFPGAFWRKLWRKLQGKPTQLLFLHGIRDAYQNHPEILIKFAEVGIDVYGLNMPGHGNSPWPITHITWEVLVKIVDNFVFEHELDNFILAGYSMGGGIALKYAEQHADRRLQLLLIAPFCEAITPLSIPERILGAEEFIRRIYLARRNMQKAEPLRGDQIHILEHYSRLFMNYSLDFTKLKQPLTVILNAEDGIIPRHTVQHLVDNVAHAKCFDIPGYHHDIYFVPADQLEQYANFIITHGT
jgi:pimeloyl-ACP methyl ester carboxylesterase